MSENPRSKQPFERLGRQLKKMRVNRKESLAEVSGAVEIEADHLSVIEQGKNRPSEDILLLLISHFEIKEEEAEKLWELAGYLPDEPTTDDKHQAVVLNAEDLKIVYTDMVHVSVNDFGVIMNFMQGGGPNSQPLAISRVGMSREHAISVLELLQKTLSAHQKQLPSPKTSKKNKK
jgi:transcriptional regulator with XRE-family HTH domain